MARSKAILGAAAVALVAALLARVLTLAPGDDLPATTSPARDATGARAATVAAPVVVSHTSTATIALPELTPAIAAALPRGRDRTADTAAAAAILTRARSGKLHPVDAKRALEDLARRGGAGGVATALLGLRTDDPPALRFQVALALSAHLTPAITTRLLAGLDAVPAAVKPDVVFALRGSDERRVDRAFAGLYTARSEAPRVRRTAAFVLAGAGRLARLTPTQRTAALATARRDLRHGQPGDVTAAADVLGAAPLAQTDRAWLEGVVTGARDSRRRLAALRALAASGLQPKQLAATLAAVARDPSASPTLRSLARSLRTNENGGR